MNSEAILKRDLIVNPAFIFNFNINKKWLMIQNPVIFFLNCLETWRDRFDETNNTVNNDFKYD